MPKKCDQLEVIEEEMPSVFYLTDIKHPEGLPYGAAADFWRCTVPVGKRLIVKKAGVASFDASHEPTDRALITTGTGGWHEYTTPYSEPNLEFSAGTFVLFHAYNAASSGKSEFGVWFMFDFIPM